MIKLLDEQTAVERAVLLGLPTLLSATADLFTAVAAAGLSLICMVAARLAALVFARLPYTIRWALVLAVSFSVAWGLAELLPLLLPLAERSLIFLKLAGVMPVIFYPSADQGRKHKVSVSALFLLFLPLFGLIREFLGRGTVFGYLATPGRVTPAGIFGSPFGAFLLAALLLLVSRAQVLRRPSKEAAG